MFRKLKRRLCLRLPRFKLYCIRRALHLEKRNWQTDFALGYDNWVPAGGPCNRRSGKTVAVMLRMLMQNLDEIDYEEILSFDPDYIPSRRVLVRWYWYEYRRLARICEGAAIPVPEPYNWGRP